MSTASAARGPIRYDHQAMIRGENGMNRIGPEAIKARIVQGHKMNTILIEAYEEAVQQDKDDQEARSIARKARDQYAKDADITPKYITDFQGIAKRFGPDKWNQDLISQAFWKILQVFSQKKLDEEYVRRFILLHIHGQHDPQCPNAIIGSVSLLESYKEATEAQVAEVNAKYEALMQEQGETEENAFIQHAQADAAFRSSILRLLPAPTPDNTEEITALTQNIQGKDAEVARLSLEMDDLERTLSHVQSDSLEKDKLISDLKKAVEEEDAAYKELERNSKEDVRAFEKSLTSLEEKLQKAEEEREQYRSTWLEYLEKYQVVERELAEYKSSENGQLIMLQSRLDSLLKSKESTDQAYRQLAHDLHLSEQKVRSLEGQLTYKSDTADLLCEQNALLRQMLNDTKQHHHLRAELSRDNISLIRDQINQLQTTLTKLAEDE